MAGFGNFLGFGGSGGGVAGAGLGGLLSGSFNTLNDPRSWTPGGPEQFSTVSPQQQSLYGGLANFYQGKLNQDPLAFLQEGGFGQNYFNALLGPSLNDYMTRGIPGINDQFSGINGIFNTKRGQAIAQGLTGIYQNAQNQYAQAIPQLSQMQYTPATQALQFALSPTQQTEQVKPGIMNQTLSGFFQGI